MAVDTSKPRPEGPKGEGWVWTQLVLICAYLFLPPMGPFRVYEVFRGFGALILGGGALFSLGGLQGLGWTKTRVFPKPMPNAQLVTEGAYQFCRHPIYFGLILMALGWALYHQYPTQLALSAVLGVFFNLKSLREEKWLVEKFPDYAAYQARVKRLVPGLF